MNAEQPSLDLSIVTTIYNSKNYIVEFYQRAKAEAEKITNAYEIIFVNDGSPDDSLIELINLHKQDPHVVVIDLARNHGHHRAMMIGLTHAQGKHVFLIDSDLEENPELLGDFYPKMINSDYDVIYGLQEKRKGNVFEACSGKMFYKVINFLSQQKIPESPITARLMTKNYVSSLVSHQEKEMFILDLFANTGYKQLGITVIKKSKGSSTYTFRKKMILVFNAVTSMSDFPLKFIFYSGLVISFLALLAIFYVFVHTLIAKTHVSGWASLILSLWFIGGLNIFFIGIIGIYLSKIFIETKNRPYSVIKAIHKNSFSA